LRRGSFIAIPNAERDIESLAHKIVEFPLYGADLAIREGALRQSDFNKHDGVRIERGKAKSASILIPHKRLHAKFSAEPQLNVALSLLKRKGILRGEKGRKVHTDLIKHSNGLKKRYYHFDVDQLEGFRGSK